MKARVTRAAVEAGGAACPLAQICHATSLLFWGRKFCQPALYFSFGEWMVLEVA